jgi:hypothetical protein
LPGDQGNPLLIGSFVPGTDSVIGFDSVASDVSSQGDTFGLALSAGQHIDSISLDITNNTNTADGFQLTIFQSPFAQVEQQDLAPGGSGVFSFTPFASQTPGQYNFSIVAKTGIQPSNGFDWEWNIVVGATTPEPSSWAMLLIGFGGIGALAYRRSRGVSSPVRV